VEAIEDLPGVHGGSRVTEQSHAVFLSYAPQDAPAAQRIRGALRNAGIIVSLDQSELRGGDVWDQKIRREISDCARLNPGDFGEHGVAACWFAVTAA
jgi:hypothetical protein